MNRFAYLLIGIIFICNHAGESYAQILEEDLLVEAGGLGKIRGKRETTLGQRREYAAFLGMRYAEAPTESHRFVPSVRFNGSLSENGGTFDATAPGRSCYQPNISLPVAQSEDCLTINVYSPKPHAQANDLLPVIFFIHGGAFTAGQGSMYNGHRLLNKDCVLVSFNYRLGVLGFFSLGTKDAPGNAGLYDMLNALKWTRDYIRYFGGDPNKITIAGQSAGSVAVTHLIASPLAKGLFHGAIAASGTALAAWGTTVNPLENSLVIARKCNCYNSTSQILPNAPDLQKITECMQTVDPVTIVNALFEFQVEERKEGRLGFEAVSPTVQDFDPSPELELILPEHPRQVFETGRQANVPLMQGTTRHDGSYVLGVYYNRYLKENGYLDNPGFMTREAVPRILTALGIPDEYGVYDSIAKTYLGDSRFSGEFCQMYPGFIDLFSVFFFKASSYQTALFQSRLNNDTYWYSFDYKGAQTVFSLLFKPIEIPPIQSGITHGDDLMYVFSASLMDLNPQDYEISNRMVEYWVNFATYGNPTPDQLPPSSPTAVKWTRLKEADINAEFLSIDRESIISHHYEDTWADAGWELLPPTPSPSSSSTTTTTSSTTPSTPSGNTGSTQANTGTSPGGTETTSSTVSEETTQPTESTTGGNTRLVPINYFIAFTILKLILTPS